MRDLISHVAAVKAVAAAAYTTGSQVGDIIDLSKYNSAAILVHSHAWTDGTFTATVEHGNDAALADTAAATIANGLLSPDSVLAVAAANKRAFAGYIGDKRYIRVTLVAANAATGGVVGVDVLQGNPLDAPVVH